MASALPDLNDPWEWELIRSPSDLELNIGGRNPEDVDQRDDNILASVGAAPPPHAGARRQDPHGATVAGRAKHRSQC